VFDYHFGLSVHVGTIKSHEWSQKRRKLADAANRRLTIAHHARAACQLGRGDVFYHMSYIPCLRRLAAGKEKHHVVVGYFMLGDYCSCNWTIG